MKSKEVTEKRPSLGWVGGREESCNKRKKSTGTCVSLEKVDIWNGFTVFINVATE